MNTTYWRELNDNQAETVSGGKGGIPGVLYMGYKSTYTYYNADGSVIYTDSWGGGFDDAYPDGVFNYKDALNRVANEYILKQAVLRDPAKHFQDLTTTRTSRSTQEDGSYWIYESTDYNFGFEYVMQGNSKVIL